MEKIFLNYVVSFHNGLWSSAFSGKFAAGTTWHWERVFWWPDSQKPAPTDLENPFHSGGQSQFNNGPNQWNTIRVNDVSYPIRNQSVYHNFKALTDLFNHPSWAPYDFFSGDFKVRRNEDFTDYEAYYLQNGALGEPATVAIGWVRNKKASLFDSYYLARSAERFFACEAPNPTTSPGIHLPGFEPGNYHISWFPTRMNSTIHPPDQEDVPTTFSGTLYLDLAGQFGSIASDYLDTLRSDYAFIITPEPFVKQRVAGASTFLEEQAGFDFQVFPNPAQGAFSLRFSDDAVKEVMVLDVLGRSVACYPVVRTMSMEIQECGLPQGAYWVRVSDGYQAKTRKVIVH